MTKKITIQPRGKYILVLRDEAKTHETQYGLIVPENIEKEQRAFGTVIAVGADIKDVKKGDRVVYGAFAGEEIEVEEGSKKVTYRILEDEFVIAFLK